MLVVTYTLPAFCVPGSLNEMLNTFQENAIDNFEILIVDDGSNEETTEIACTFLSDPRVRLIKMNQHVFAH